MSSRFRIVHFMPDPFSGARVPIAALVEGQDRSVRVTRAPFIPGPHCVGGRAAWTSLQMTLEDLDLADNFEVLPRSIGPFVVMDEARKVPAQVGDPVRWVTQHILPRPPIHAEDLAERPPPAIKRQVMGLTFFTRHKVARYVQPRFDGTIVTGVRPDTAEPISQWVPGKEGLLLMEPVVAGRESFHEDLRHVSSTFLAWRKVFENHGIQKRMPSFIAYVLSGRRGESADARAALQEARATVVDVMIPAESKWLIDSIKTVGRSGGDQGELPLD